MKVILTLGFMLAASINVSANSGAGDRDSCPNNDRIVIDMGSIIFTTPDSFGNSDPIPVSYRCSGSDFFAELLPNESVHCCSYVKYQIGSGSQVRVSDDCTSGQYKEVVIRPNGRFDAYVVSSSCLSN